LKATSTEAMSASRQHAEEPNAGTADPNWGWLYNIGGTGALFVAAIIPAQAVVFVAWGQPDTARGWFDQFQSNTLAGLLAFEILFVVNAVLGLATTLALYVALRRFGEAFMALALALGLLEAAAFVVARPAPEMLFLSDRYADAATDAQREALVAAVWRCGTRSRPGPGPFAPALLLPSVRQRHGRARPHRVPDAPGPALRGAGGR